MCHRTNVVLVTATYAPLLPYTVTSIIPSLSLHAFCMNRYIVWLLLLVCVAPTNKYPSSS